MILRAIFCALLLFFAMSMPAMAGENMQLSIQIGDEVISAVLEKNSITEQLRELSPMTMDMKDFSQTEKIAYPPKALSIEAVSHGFRPKAGDIAVYGPWGNICIFYRNGEYSSDLYYLGKVTSGLDIISRQKNGFKTTWNFKSVK